MVRIKDETAGSFGWAATRSLSFLIAGGLALSFLLHSPRLARAAEDPTYPPQGGDTLGEAELEASGGPTFESVSRHFPPMRHPKEVIGVAESPQEIAVLPDGSLLFHPAWVTTCFTIDGTAARFGLNALENRLLCDKRLVGGHLPIVMASASCEGLPCEQTILAWSPGMSPDAPTVAYLRLKVTNPEDAERTVPIQYVTDKPAVSWDLEVAPGKAEYVYLKAPADAPGEAEKVDAAEFDQRLAETTEFWEALLSKGMQINVPEQRVNDAWRAWLAYNFINVDKQANGVYEPHDGGAGCYPHVFGYSASRYCYALDLWGYHAEAQRYLDSILTFVSPEGMLVVNYGLPDTGAQLWAMSRHYQMTHDKVWLRKVAPTMLKMCDWIIAKRKESMAEQNSEDPWYGMIKGRPYCDEITPAYSYHTDTYFALGLSGTAAALREIGLEAEADRLQKEGDAYHQDILTSMERAIIERDGMQMLPMFPETHALLKQANYTGAGHCYYNLVSSVVLETGLLRAEDPRVNLIIDLLQQKGGLLLGACAFDVGIDHAYTYGYWMNCLQRNEVDRVILGFYTSLAYGMSRDTYSSVEITLLRTGDNAPTLPHLYSGTQQLLLLRNMLVREEGNNLLLGQAIPRQWQEAGKKIEVRDAPTFFGKIGYAMEAAEDGNGLTVRLDPPADSRPEQIRIFVRDPQLRAIKSVTINGAASDDFETDSITVAQYDGPIVAEVRYE